MSNSNTKFLPLSLIFLWYFFPLPAQVSGQPRSSDKTIFILAGQSNMAGRGGVINNIWDGVVPEQCRASPWTLRFNPHLEWEEAEEPLHRGIDTNRTCGIGPGMAFGHALIEKGLGLGTIGLVPCAVGGTNISQWARGGALYRRLLRRSLASVREGGTIRALIWYQGESDTVVLQDAQAYQRRLERFFVDFRTDLESPMLPIIQVAIASGEGPYIEIVRQAQIGIDLLNQKTIDASGLPLEPDHLHLTTPAQLLLGDKLANAFLQFLPSVQVHQSNIGNILLNNSLYMSLMLFILIATLQQKV